MRSSFFISASLAGTASVCLAGIPAQATSVQEITPQPTLPSLHLVHAWTAKAKFNFSNVLTVNVAGGTKQVFDITGGNFTGPKLNSTSFKGFAESSRLVNSGESYQEVKVTLWGTTDTGEPFLASELGRGDPKQPHQLRHVTFETGSKNEQLRLGSFISVNEGFTGDVLTVDVFEIVDSAIKLPN